jgi:preprotein translocase subunit SecY
VFLVLIALIPMLLGDAFNIDQSVSQFFGGTSVLITVGVLLDTMRQMETHLLNRHYDGFLKKGRMKGRF